LRKISNSDEELFASWSEDKLANLEIENGLGNTPLLAGCCTRMQCKTVHQHEGGDHYVGEVVDLVNNPVPPLVFQAGKYALASRKVDETPLIPSVGTEFTGDFLGYLLWRADF
jgi:3-hydroxy-9,10-secoandrosta-1,3,5(10)-triene-9,17-dione monooxygenase reductase component